MEREDRGRKEIKEETAAKISIINNTVFLSLEINILRMFFLTSWESTIWAKINPEEHKNVYHLLKLVSVFDLGYGRFKKPPKKTKTNNK